MFVNWLKFFPSFHDIKKSRFVRHVAVISGGTAVAQIITIAFSPAITRLYGPGAFGILGVFVAVVAIISPIASLTYAYAIVIPASDSDARALLNLSLRIGVGIAVISTVIFGGLHHQIAHATGFDAAAPYLLLVPLVLFFSTAEQAFQQQLIRKKKFRSISTVAVAQSAAMGASKAGIGLFATTAPVLLVLNTIGHVLHTVLLWLGVRSTLVVHHKSSNSRGNSTRVTSLKTVAHTYRDFPLYRAPRALLKSISKNLPILILAAFFGPVPAGFYALTNKVLTLPSALISQSVGTVFFPRIAEAAHRKEKFRPLILKATGGLALIGLLPFCVIFAFGPWLFSFVFGVEWITAGEYARWLALWQYFGFISAPCVIAIPLMGLQGQLLAYEVLTFVIRIGALVFGAIVLANDMSVIALFSIAGMLLYIGLLAWVLLRSGTCLREGLRRDNGGK